MLLFGTLSTAPIANAASPEPSPAGAASKHKASPDAIKAARLTRLKNQAGLTADQEAKAKPIIDKYVDDRQAANGDRKKLLSLKTQFDSDINAILTPDQQTKLPFGRPRSTSVPAPRGRAAGHLVRWRQPARLRRTRDHLFQVFAHRRSLLRSELFRLRNCVGWCHLRLLFCRGSRFSVLALFV